MLAKLCWSELFEKLVALISVSPNKGVPHQAVTPQDLHLSHDLAKERAWDHGLSSHPSEKPHPSTGKGTGLQVTADMSQGGDIKPPHPHTVAGSISPPPRPHEATLGRSYPCLEPCGGPRAMQWSKPKPNTRCQMRSPKPLAQQAASISPLHVLVELMSISAWA